MTPPFPVVTACDRLGRMETRPQELPYESGAPSRITDSAHARGQSPPWVSHDLGIS